MTSPIKRPHITFFYPRWHIAMDEDLTTGIYRLSVGDASVNVWVADNARTYHHSQSCVAKKPHRRVDRSTVPHLRVGKCCEKEDKQDCHRKQCRGLIEGVYRFQGVGVVWRIPAEVCDLVFKHENGTVLARVCNKCKTGFCPYCKSDHSGTECDKKKSTGCVQCDCGSLLYKRWCKLHLSHLVCWCSRQLL